jgi:superfamily II DNA or RNA helicase
MPISLSDHFDAETLAAARPLVRGRRVTDLQWFLGNTIHSCVKTDEGETYVQAISVDQPSPLKPAGAIHGTCSCPEEENCVHVAAALLETMRPSRLKRSPTAARSDLRSWMGRLRALNATLEPRKGAPRVTNSGAGSAKREVILYVADIQDSRLRVEICRGAPPAMGGRGAVKRFDVLKLLGEREGAPDFVSEADLDLLTRLATRHLLKGQHPINMDLPALLRQTGELDTGLVRDLCATGRFLPDLNADRPLSWSDQTLTPDVGWVANGGAEMRLRFFPDSPDPIRIVRLEAQGFWLGEGSLEIGPLSAVPTAEFIRLVESSPPLDPVERESVEQIFNARRWDRPVSVGTQEAEEVVRPAKTRRAHLRLYGLHAHKGRYLNNNRQTVLLPSLRLSFTYEGVRVRPFDGGRPTLTEEGSRTLLERDRDWEMGCLNRLLSAGAVQVDEVLNHTLTGVSEPQDLVFETITGAAGGGSATAFAFRTLRDLKAEGWEVETAPSWPIREDDSTSRLLVETVRANGDEFAGHGWFDLGFFVEIGEKRFNLIPLITAFLDQVARDHPVEELLDGSRLEELLRGQPVLVDRGNGYFAEVDLSPISDAVHLFLKNSVRDRSLHPAESRYAVEVAEALAGSPVAFSDNAGILPLGRALSDLIRTPQPETPAGVRAQLRPYQAFGAAWMDGLVSTGFGGLLADDMGLGKTLQVLTLLQARRERGVRGAPALLVVPTSLLHGWREQAARFTPDLRLLTLHGAGRGSVYGRVGEADLVMTTYQILTNDLAFLRRREWSLLVVDEAQNLKNPDSNMSRSLRQVPAAGRLALTGTPMENTLQDLWSLFDWLNPGLLGNRKTFRELFRTPIEKRGDADAQARLNRRVGPFLLRRTKDAVAADLPPRTEIIDEVVLDAGQKALYESVRSVMDERIRDVITQRGLAGSHVTILDALLKLRQVCCDPALVKSDAARKVRRSAKRERLLELLQELVAEGRRVLVFSQFVEMLDLIGADLDRAGIEHLVLTGQTRRRDRVLDAFRDGSAPVFLISLKAGGVGLNLTEADTVILYDPWWNPAVESQAMDRVHRIGQDKPVFVHRLVAAGTVEERILSLQDRKRALADALLKEGENDPVKKLIDEETLADLFAPLRG